MPSTLKYQITYPAGNVAPNVPLVMQQSAESVEAALDAIETDWQPLTLTAAWVAYVGGGGYYNGLRWRKVGTNVQIQGMIRSGAAGSFITTLPVAARPEFSIMQVCEANAAGTYVTVLIDTTNGNMSYRSGAAAPSYLNINMFYPVAS